MTRPIEFLRAWDDNTWDIITLSIPDNIEGDEAVAWLRGEGSSASLPGQDMTSYGFANQHSQGSAVLWAIYNIPNIKDTDLD